MSANEVIYSAQIEKFILFFYLRFLYYKPLLIGEFYMKTILTFILTSINPNVKPTLVLPYPDRQYYIKGYDDTAYPPLESVPRRLAIIRRNEWMVDESDYIIAYVWHYDGARNTLEIAKRKKKPIFNVALKKS